MTTAVIDARVKKLKAEEKAQAKAAKREHDKQLREQAAREIAREQARAAQAELKRLAAEADASLAAFGPELVVAYRAIRYVVCPEQTTDPGVRQTALNSLREVQAICMSDFEARRYEARMKSMGKTDDRRLPWRRWQGLVIRVHGRPGRGPRGRFPYSRPIGGEGRVRGQRFRA